MAAYQAWLMFFRFLAVLLALLSAPLPAGAQPATGKVPRVGVLGVTSAAGYARQVEALRQGFRDLGYVEGQNIVIDYRWAEGRYDRLPALAAELIRLQPDVLVTSVLLNPGNRNNDVGLETVKKTATALNVDLFEAPARAPHEFDEAFALMLRRRADGLVVLSDSMLVANMRRLGDLSTAKRLPGAGSDEYAEGGGLLAYGVNFPELWRRAPYFVDKILKGGKPATIPVEQASKFSFIVNLKTATALKLPIQPSLLLRADHVIQ